MQSIVEEAIKILIKDVKAGMPPDQALKITQACLNLAHVIATVDLVK